MSDDSEKVDLERLCKLCIDNGFSTGHADTAIEFAGECVANLLDGKKKIEQLQAKVPVWIPAEEFQAKLTEPYAEEWVGWKDKRGNDQLRRAYMDIGQAADYHWWDCKTHEALPPTFTGNLYVLKFLPPIPPLDQGEEQ
jgi:hypothetical protein